MLEFLKILHLVIHYSSHLLLPWLIAWVFFREKWQVVWIIMISTMLVDLDHLLANPIFEPNRCGIGFHPLHSYYAIGLYLLILFIPNIYLRIIAVGLLLHIFTDLQDCLWIRFLG